MDYKKKYLKYKAKYLNTKKQIKGGGRVAEADLRGNSSVLEFLGNTASILTEYAGKSVAGAANSAYNTTTGVVNYTGETMAGAAKGTYDALYPRKGKPPAKSFHARG
tara:strand:+ start:287 stop:607 length:321 start_codon:yes stop_codon:yes gene_type:complete